MMRKANQIPTWMVLSRAIELQFGPSQFECPRAKLFKLVQQDSMVDYYKDFMILANRVEGLTDDALLDCFISGHKGDIKRDVIAQSPTSLLRAVSLARLFNEKQLVGFSNANHHPTIPNSLPLPVLTPNPPWKSSSTTASFCASSSNSKAPFPLLHFVKKMSPVEMQLRRDKGLCYACDEKFSWNHCCPNRQYLLFQSKEDVTPEDNPTILLLRFQYPTTYLLMP